jgi:hypothetical protein
MTHAAGERPAGGFAHRWSTGYSASVAGHGSLVLPTASVVGSGTRAGVWLEGLVTLLGPEGTGTGFGVCCLQAACGLICLVGGWGCGVRAGLASIPHLGFLLVGDGWVLVVVVGWFRSCFENCIVNASILFLLCSSFLGHTVDALASGADEGRGSLRYAPGSWQPSVDPGVSEWGNLAPVMGCCRRLNV